MKFYRVFTYSLILWLIHHKIRFIQCTDTTPGLTGSGQSQTSSSFGSQPSSSPPLSSGSGTAGTAGSSGPCSVEIDVTKKETCQNYICIIDDTIYTYEGAFGIYRFNKVKEKNTVIWEAGSGESSDKVEYDPDNNKVTIYISGGATKTFKKGSDNKWVEDKSGGGKTGTDTTSENQASGQSGTGGSGCSSGWVGKAWNYIITCGGSCNLCSSASTSGSSNNYGSCNSVNSTQDTTPATQAGTNGSAESTQHCNDADSSTTPESNDSDGSGTFPDGDQDQQAEESGDSTKTGTDDDHSSGGGSSTSEVLVNGLYPDGAASSHVVDVTETGQSTKTGTDSGDGSGSQQAEVSTTGPDQATEVDGSSASPESSDVSGTTDDGDSTPEAGQQPNGSVTADHDQTYAATTSDSSETKVVVDNQVVDNGCGCTWKNVLYGTLTLGGYNIYKYCTSKSVSGSTLYSSDKTGVTLDINTKRGTDQFDYEKKDKIVTFTAKDNYAFNQVRQSILIWETKDSNKYATKVELRENCTLTIFFGDGNDKKTFKKLDNIVQVKWKEETNTDVQPTG